MKPFAVTVLALLVLTTPIGAQTIVEHGAPAPMHASGVSISPGTGYSGQCCEPDVSCCASLWANYCQEKRDCCNAVSPRRSVCGHPSCVGGCCGFPFQMGACCPKICLPSFRGFRLHHARSDDCAAGCSAPDASCAADCVTNNFGGLSFPAADDAVGSGVPSTGEEAEAALPQPEPTDEADVPPPEPAPAPPAPEDSARRWFRPFPWVK